MNEPVLVFDTGETIRLSDLATALLDAKANERARIVALLRVWGGNWLKAEQITGMGAPALRKTIELLADRIEKGE